MNTKLHTLFKVIIFLFITVGGTLAFNISHIGSIEDNLFAPTSMTITQDKIAVLEPFSKEIKIFSSDGLISHKINFSGHAHGLTVFNDYYFFCDIDDKKIIAINSTTSEQLDLFENKFVFDNPVDINVCKGQLTIMDAGLSAIYQFDEHFNVTRKIPIRNSRDEQVHAVASFAYNKNNSTYIIFDQVKSSVMIIDETGKFLTEFGSYGSQLGEITRGGDILLTPDNLIVITDRYQNRVLTYNVDGKFEGYFDLSATSNNAVNIPSGMALDNNGLLFVASTEGANIQIFQIATSIGEAESILAELMYPNLNDTVSIENVKMIVSSELKEKDDKFIGFDFELYKNETMEQPLLKIEKIEPIITQDSVTNFMIYVGEWMLSEKLESDKMYNWRSRIRFADSTSQWSEFSTFKTSSLPIEYSLSQNYPNPFNPTTNIAFSIPEQTHVKLEIFNIIGQRISSLVDVELTAGNHEIKWDGTNENGRAVATGLYFYRLSTENFIQSKKMVMVK
ncbi:MAG: 6-bladed beta-propeller [Bacteroidota bacterium]|nr:6-bladed beta-propeller [Bacteroidota bacterium]